MADGVSQKRTRADTGEGGGGGSKNVIVPQSHKSIYSNFEPVLGRQRGMQHRLHLPQTIGELPESLDHVARVHSRLGLDQVEGAFCQY
jgi:hypothetical protein